MVLFYKNPENEKESISYYIKYNIELSPTGNANYELYLPILKKENGNISEVMENLSVTGNGNIQILNTTYGLVLKVKGYGKISINGYLNGEFSVSYFNLISQETGGGNVKYWIYYNSSFSGGVEVYALGEVMISSVAHISYIQEVISVSGWQEVDGIKCTKQP